MCAYRVLGENRSVFKEEHFSRGWRGKKESIEKAKKLSKDELLRFKCLDDDGVTYFWGVSTEESFRPLDCLGEAYGCTAIMYKDKETGKYEYL